MTSYPTPAEAKTALGEAERLRRLDVICPDCRKPGHVPHDLSDEAVAWLFGVSMDTIDHWRAQRIPPFEN